MTKITNELIAQLFAALGLIGVSAGNNQKEKVYIVNWFVFANAMYGIQYFLLSAYAGVVSSIICGIRVIVFYLFEKFNRPKSMPILCLFLFLTLIMGVYSCENAYDLLPLITTIILTWGLWQTNLRVFRFCALVEPITYFIYDLHIGAYVSALGCIIELAGVCLAIYRLDIKKQKGTN